MFSEQGFFPCPQTLQNIMKVITRKEILPCFWQKFNFLLELWTESTVFHKQCYQIINTPETTVFLWQSSSHNSSFTAFPVLQNHCQTQNLKSLTLCAFQQVSPYHSSPKCTLVADTLLAGPAENTELLMMVFTPSTKKYTYHPQNFPQTQFNIFTCFATQSCK